jgi:hypothetical protein
VLSDVFASRGLAAADTAQRYILVHVTQACTLRRLLLGSLAAESAEEYVQEADRQRSMLFYMKRADKEAGEWHADGLVSAASVGWFLSGGGTGAAMQGLLYASCP